MISLRLHDSNNIIDSDFGYWLVSKIRVRLISNFRNYNFKRWDNYLTESKEVTRLYSRNYTAYEIVDFAASNIICNSSTGEITISINNNKFVPGFDRLKLSTIVKTINYGTLDIKGCSIFTDTFNHFAENIDTYASIYYRI